MKIDPKIRDLIRPLSTDELTELEVSVLREGIRDPLVLWAEEGVLLDGHHRHMLASKHGILFETAEVSLPDRDAALLWVLKNQRARRNLAPAERTYYIGCEYEIGKRQGARNDLTSPQDEEKLPAKRIGDDHGVSRATVERAGQFARAVDAIAEVVPEAKPRLLNGEMSLRNQDVITLASEAPDRIRAEVERMVAGKRPRVTHNSGNYEWYSPQPIVDCARQVMGEIDLDPASCEEANRIVDATKFYTAKDDGLAQPWAGRVYLNPPYASALIVGFIDRLVDAFRAGAVTQAVVLTNNATDTRWFAKLVEAASAIVFSIGRLRFWKEGDSDTPDSPLQGQAIAYLGPKVDVFLHEFGAVGWGARIEGRPPMAA